jgi:hypothetical protein
VQRLPRDIRRKLVNVFDIMRVEEESDFDALIEALQRWKNGEREELAEEFGQDFWKVFALLNIESNEDLGNLIEILKSLGRAGSWRSYR